MQNSLIVGVDGTEPGLRAIDWAVVEAAYHGVPLRLVHATLWDPYERDTSPDSTAEGVISSASQRVARTDPTVEMSTATVPADPIAALLQEGESGFAVVVGTRGRGGIAGMLLGSTSLEVAARSTCPVGVVRGAASTAHSGLSRVTLGVGTSGKLSAAAEFAFREAQARNADLHAHHAWHHPARALPVSLT